MRHRILQTHRFTRWTPRRSGPTSRSSRERRGGISVPGLAVEAGASGIDTVTGGIEVESAHVVRVIGIAAVAALPLEGVHSGLR